MPLRSRPAGAAALVLAVLVARSAAGDEAPAPTTPLAFGTRVRVHTERQGRIVAYLAQERPDALVVDRRRDDKVERLTLPRADIRGLEVSERPSRKGTGALVGMLVGVAGGVLLGVLGGDEGCGSASLPNTLGNFSANLSSATCVSKGEGAFLGALALGPLSAGVGALLAPGEKWRRVDQPSVQVRVTTPPGGGAVVRLSLSF
jgi:hypothetical protein